MAYATQMDAAKQGIITKETAIGAQREFNTPEESRELVACGPVCSAADLDH